MAFRKFFFFTTYSLVMSCANPSYLIFVTLMFSLISVNLQLNFFFNKKKTVIFETPSNFYFLSIFPDLFFSNSRPGYKIIILVITACFRSANLLSLENDSFVFHQLENCNTVQAGAARCSNDCCVCLDFDFSHNRLTEQRTLDETMVFRWFQTRSSSPPSRSCRHC